MIDKCYRGKNRMAENQPRPWDAVLGGNNPPAIASTFENKKQQAPVQTEQVNNIAQNLSSPSTEDTNLAGCTTFIKWVFWFLLTVGYFNTPEMSFVESIEGLWGSAGVIGLLSPSLVVRFGLPRSRWTVILIYLAPALVLGAISSPN